MQGQCIVSPYECLYPGSSLCMTRSNIRKKKDTYPLDLCLVATSFEVVWLVSQVKEQGRPFFLVTVYLSRVPQNREGKPNLYPTPCMGQR